MYFSVYGGARATCLWYSFSNMIIIGITGTLGAGKGEAVEYLKTKGFAHFPARAYILDEVRKRGLELNRDNTTLVANDLRITYGPSYIIENLFKQARASGSNCVIESIRTLGELNFLRTQPDFYLMAVDADPKIRYERIVKRKSELDHVSFEKFLSDEKREMSSTDLAKGNISECIAQADFPLMNNSSKEELHRQIETVLHTILKK